MTSSSSHTADVSRRTVLRRGAAVIGGVGGLTATTGLGAARACDIVVPNDYATIQAAVDSATAGDTICVRPGTYAEDVTVDTGVTLRGQTAPHSARPAHVDGQVTVDTGGDGAEIRRLRIAASQTFSGETFPDPAGVKVKASDVVVEDNVVEGFTADLGGGGGSFTIHGIQVFGETAIADVTVSDNVIRGFRSEGVPGEWPKYGGIAGVKLQAGVSDTDVTGNRITDHHAAGWVWGVVLTTSGSAPGTPAGITVTDNHVEGLNDGSVYDVFAGPNEGRDAAPYPGSAVGIDGIADAGGATVTANNLLAPNGAESKDGEGTLAAECNWWGAKSGPTHDANPDGEGTWALERGTAAIDYAPWLVAPAPSRACVGGKSNGTGTGKGG